MQPPVPNSKPVPEDIAHLVRCLAELRNALVVTSQALLDYHGSLESSARQAAAEQTESLLQRIGSRDRGA